MSIPSWRSKVLLPMQERPSGILRCRWKHAPHHQRRTIWIPVRLPSVTPNVVCGLTARQRCHAPNAMRTVPVPANPATTASLDGLGFECMAPSFNGPRRSAAPTRPTPMAIFRFPWWIWSDVGSDGAWANALEANSAIRMVTTINLIWSVPFVLTAPSLSVPVAGCPPVTAIERLQAIEHRHSALQLVDGRLYRAESVTESGV